MKKVVSFIGLVMLTATLYAQEQVITGQVTDLTNGETLPGVNILVKGTAIGTVTNVAGDYRLSVPDDAETLVFSSVGYTSEEVAVGNQTTLDLALSPDIQSLSEIVVVGYGTQDKKELTGAISSVNSEAIKDLPVTGLDQALAGQVPGVQVSQSNAAPGGAVNIRVRGTVSINSGSQPLYVIDGYPLSISENQVSNPLSSINPNDIELNRYSKRCFGQCHLRLAGFQWSNHHYDQEGEVRQAAVQFGCLHRLSAGRKANRRA